jgi:hypothetical protein
MQGHDGVAGLARQAAPQGVARRPQVKEKLGGTHR